MNKIQHQTLYSLLPEVMKQNTPLFQKSRYLKEDQEVELNEFSMLKKV